MDTDETTPELQAVIGDAPAAVLVVDLGSGAVVHANDVARQLVPDLDLPVPLEQWSDAAQLRDGSGTELSDTDHPLSRLLRAEPVHGRRVSAQRQSEMGASREPLWVVGLPMTGAPMLDDHALVVFLSLREHQATAAVEAFVDQDAEIRDRAVLATGLSFTVADARDPDLPLVWVNPAFIAATGFAFEEAVGRNCRFLQGPDTDRGEVARIRAALEAQESCTATLLNYRKDGLAFWNQVTMTPILDADGEVSHFVGVQTDVSGRIEADRQRDAALVAEHDARTRAEDAQGRLALLAQAGESLTGELDVDEARTRLLQLLVPELADMVLFFHVNEVGTITEHQSLHRDPARAELTASYAARIPELATPDGLIATLLGERAHRLLDDAFADETTAALGIGSALAVGLPGRRSGRVRDVVILHRVRDRDPFTPADVELAVDLGRRAGLILDNLRLYATQSHIAQTLQRSLLPEVPDLPGVRIEARYLAGADGAEVGGDFYDVLDLGRVWDGRPVTVTPSSPRRPFALVVGDVSGHDVYAAATMGQLKGLVQATATTQRLLPAAVLEHVDRLLPRLTNDPPVATMLFTHLEPRDDGSWLLTMSTAGHPPPLLRHPDGRLDVLNPAEARGPLLGLGEWARGEASFVLPAGSTLIAYTDGLVERRGETIDLGIERLRHAAGTASRSGASLTDHLIDTVERSRERPQDDDIVVVAVHLEPETPARP